MADLNIVYKIGVDAADPAVLSNAGGALDDQFVANLDGHPFDAIVNADRPQPDFRAAQIAEDGNRLIPPCRGLPDIAQHLEVSIQSPCEKLSRQTSTPA